MTLQELNTPEALSSFLADNSRSLVCFSATWCGPCKKSKPQLEALAASYAEDPSISVRCGLVYEHVLGDEVQTYKIRAFPTYVLFKGRDELGRVQGADFDGVKSLVGEHCKAHDFGTGTSLGGGSVAASAADARAKRLARFGGGVDDNTPSEPAAKKQDAEKEAPDAVMKDASSPAPEPETAAPAAGKTEEGDSKMDVDEPEEKTDQVEMVDPTKKLKQEDITTLTESMGFSLIRAQKGLLSGNGTVEGAVEWLLVHQEDADIEDPIEMVPKAGPAAGKVSYKCVATGKIFSSIADLELHANRTGHSDFEETTESKKPLTPEEKQAKILEIKALLKKKRTQREQAEKADDVDREKQRRFMGKEMVKTREQLEIQERKRVAQQRKREKEAALKERQRIRAELEKDKRERAANKGKLKGRLGVDGYNPDAIQYDVPGEGGGGAVAGEGEAKKPKKAAPSAAKMDEYIAKVSSYRAGGDGGNCLKILKAYVGNVVKNPDDPKYRKINMENKAYRTKVKPFVGAKSLLLCVGFGPNDEGTAMELAEDADMKLLESAKEKIEAAYAAYMK